MVNVSRQFSSSPPTSDSSTNQSIFLKTNEKLLNNNKIQLKSPNRSFASILEKSAASSVKTNFQHIGRPRRISPSKEEDKILESQSKEIEHNNVERMTAEHIHRHLQQFRPQQNMLILPPTSTESSASINMQPLFKNGRDNSSSKENKSDSISSNGSTLKSAFSIRSLLSGGVESKDGVAGQISNEFSHHLSRLAAPFSHIYPPKHLENNQNNPPAMHENAHGNEDYVDVDGGMLEDEEEEDIDLDEDESLDNNEDSKCDDENVSEDGKESSSGGEGKKSSEKEENLTPEEKEKV